MTLNLFIGVWQESRSQEVALHSVYFITREIFKLPSILRPSCVDRSEEGFPLLGGEGVHADEGRHCFYCLFGERDLIVLGVF